MRCLKKLLTVCMATALLVSTAPMALTSAAGLEPLSKNLIANGNFENGRTGWKTEGNTTTEETTGPDGSKAIAVTQDAGGKRFLMDSKIAIERNALYKLSVDVKLSQDLVNKNTSISILDSAATDLIGDEVGREYDVNRRIAMDYTGNLPADQWTTLSGYYRYNGAKASGFTTDFGLEVNNAGTYAVDNFSIVKVSEPEKLVIDYTKEGTPNPWVAPASNPIMTVKSVSMEKQDGSTGNVLHFARNNKSSSFSEYYLPVEVNPDGTDRRYMVSFYAKLDESTAVVQDTELPADVGLYPILKSRGSGDYSTGYGSPTKITSDAWTKFSFTVTKKSSFALELRPLRADAEGKFSNTNPDTDARKFSYYLSDLSIMEVGKPDDLNKNNQLIYGEFNNNETLSGWSYSGITSKEWISDENGNGYVKLIGAGMSDGGAKNIIAQNLRPSNNQLIKRDTWYRISSKIKLEAAEADAVNAQMYIFNTSEPKFVNDAWTDQSYYNTDSFQVKKADGWTEVVSYLRFSGIETAPATKEGYYEEGKPVQYLNNENTVFAFRLYNSAIQSCDVSFDDIIIEEVGAFANGGMEDVNTVRFNNNHVYGDAIKKGDGASNDSLTQGNAYTDLNNATFTKEAAHSGEYGLLVEGSKANQTAGAAKQHVMLDASLDKYYKVSYWIKLKDPEAAKAALLEINPENTDAKIYARLLAGYMSYYDRPLAEGGTIREIGDVGTMYPTANDISDGEWHNVSFVYNPSHYNRFVSATEGTETIYNCKWKVPADSLAAANMEKIGFYLYPRISSTNYITGADTEVKLGHFNDSNPQDKGFDYYLDDVTIEEIPANQFVVTSELKTDYAGNGNVKMEVGLANTLGKDQSATILVAQYDSNNALVSVNNVVATTIYKDKNGYGNDDKFFTGAHNFEFEVQANAAAEYMKVFVWDGLDNAIPLSKSNIYFKK